MTCASADKKNEQQQTNKHMKQFVDKYNDKYVG